MRLGYLGPAGTFSEEAMRAATGDGDGAAELVPFPSIHHRDQARLYAKQISEGAAELRLSPEEEEALRLALS